MTDPGAVVRLAAPPLTRDVVGVPVTEGPVPARWDAGVVDEPTVWADHDRLLFDAGGAAVYVEADRVVMEARSADGRAAYDWLLYATATRAVLGFRHRFNLHGTLVVSPTGAAVAVLGASGAGKSSTALALLRRGWRLACDDIVEVTTGAEGAVAHPVARPVHLADADARNLGGDVNVGRVVPDRGKRAFEMPGDLTARPLAATVLVGPRTDGTRVASTLVEPLAAVPLLAASADRYGVLHLPEHRADLLRWATSLARQVPLWEVRRPLEGATVEAVADSVEALVNG